MVERKERKAHVRIWSRVGIFALVIFAFFAQVPRGVEADEVRKAVEAANAEWTAAFNRGDAVAVAALYTEGAILMPPDIEMVRGRQGIQEFWQARIQRGLKDAVLTTVEVQADGNTAYEIGRVSLTFYAKDQAPKPISGKYVVVWKRQADGRWKLHVDIWNSAPAK
jgi:uncharacterized protein (TIGR02246 family)